MLRAIALRPLEAPLEGSCEDERVLVIRLANLAIWTPERRGYGGSRFSWLLRNAEMGETGPWRRAFA